MAAPLPPLPLSFETLPLPLPLPLPLLLLLLLLLPFLRWMAHLHEMRTQARVASHHSLAVRVGLQHSFVDYGV